jgi:glyoxylase-like metal-dependent hydrolase (beta-lactamase superfamily II)
MEPSVMQPQLIVPGVHLIPFEIGQVYLWAWDDKLTVVDTGIAGSADAIVQAVRAIGRQPADVAEIVLTHFHPDHVGSAADLAERTGAPVLAHWADAPTMRGEQPGQPPVLLDFERPIFEAVAPLVPPHPPVPGVQEVDDQQVSAGGGIFVSVPGHTPGSLALHVPQLGVLFTGDTVAHHEGSPILGVFNIDRAEAIRSLKKQAALEFETACFGHGPPIIGGASSQLRALAATF